VGKISPGDVYLGDREDAKAATGDVDLEGERVPEGCMLRLEFFGVMDLTTANKTVRLGVKRAGAVTWLKRISVGASAYGTILERPVLLRALESPVGRVESATAADVLQMVARGVYI